MKQTDAKQLYAAMDGIGEDLLERSEQTAPAVRAQKKTVRFPARYAGWLAAAAALVLLGIFAHNMLRFNGAMSTSTSPKTDLAVMESAEETEADMIMESAEEADADLGVESAEATAQMAEETMDLSEDTDAIKEDKTILGSAAKDARQANGSAEAAGVSADENAFFLFHGMVYSETETSRIPATEIVLGDFVTSVTLAKEEPAEQNDYPENTGNIAGDVYAVLGEDPEKILCMPQDDGTVILFYAAE